jgi:hypothetical protein
MDAITQWFKEKDYQEGVALYASLPGSKKRIVNNLERINNHRNMSILCRELRRLKNTPPVRPQRPKPVPVATPSITTPQSQLVETRKEVKAKSANSYFKKIQYGALPAELKLRFRLAKDIFYDMCDLKFALNDLPDEAEDKALELQLQIEALDEQRETIWKELEHWQEYKTMLPTKADIDFSSLSPQKLFLKKANLASSISKISKRIKGWKQNLKTEQDKETRLKISQQINRSQKKLHQHEINLRKIEELL